jgi:hypothetical protein
MEPPAAPTSMPGGRTVRCDPIDHQNSDNQNPPPPCPIDGPNVAVEEVYNRCMVRKKTVKPALFFAQWHAPARRPPEWRTSRGGTTEPHAAGRHRRWLGIPGAIKARGRFRHHRSVAPTCPPGAPPPFHRQQDTAAGDVSRLDGSGRSLTSPVGPTPAATPPRSAGEAAPPRRSWWRGGR